MNSSFFYVCITMAKTDKTVFLTGLCFLLGSGIVAYTLYLWRKEEKTRAVKRKRKDQGNHECEVTRESASLAMESEPRWEGCSKNPGHFAFIPANEFSIQHLPEPYRMKKLYQLVQNISARTVRLRVHYTSMARPEGFPFYHSRGEYIVHSGSGWVRDIHACYGPCRCPDCQTQATPYNRWWLVRIHTACHVVFDTSEAEQTFVDVFYEGDSEGTETAGCSRMRTMKGLRVLVKSEDQDLCRFYCITHDAELINKLQVHMRQWEKQPATFMGMSRWQEMHAPLCIIVSHPHGTAKHITIGQWVGHTEQNEIGECALTYTTATCTGSSGAPVILPRKTAVEGEWSWILSVFPHSGTLSIGVNLSAIGGVFPSI